MFWFVVACVFAGGWGLGSVYSPTVISKVHALEAKVKAMEATVAAHAEALKKAL